MQSRVRYLCICNRRRGVIHCCRSRRRMLPTAGYRCRGWRLLLQVLLDLLVDVCRLAFDDSQGWIER